jgi:hypothetical protein
MPTVYGLPACSDLAEWTPEYRKELARHGIVARFTQLNGNYGPSAGTHAGCAFDMIITDPGKRTLDAAYDLAVKIARQMGADATWERPKNWDRRGGIRHIHGLLNGGGHLSGAAKQQQASVRAGRNGLANNGPDTGPRPLSGRTWRQGIAWAKKQQAAARPKPKPTPNAKPWFNVSFANTWWNSIPGGKAAQVASSAPTLASDSAAGSPAIATFSEVRQSQLRTLDAEMNSHGYKRVAYTADNLLAAYARRDVVFLGQSFAKFKKQHGGNREGVLRLKFRVDGSRAQVGVVHLDVDSPVSYKAHNLKETYKAMRRYGIATLIPDWKSRTLIIGDFNHKTIAGQVLGPLGFKEIETNAGIDQAWVGKNRVDRGGASSKTRSDHRRIVARLGRR